MLVGGLSALALGACGRQGAASANAAGLRSAPPLKDAASFPVGTCLMTPELQDPALVDLALRHFNQITPEFEMKMERTIADDGGYRFDASDAIADFCRRNGLRLHATTLVWYAQKPPAFERLQGDRAAFEQKLRDYVSAVMGRYRGLARGWDVLNEAVAEDGDGYRGGIWQAALGDDYGRLAFELAHEADPQSLLFLNDYNLEIMPAKLDAFQRLLEGLLRAGAPVTGVGTQSHLNADLPPGQAARAIQALARFGLPIHISELDISTRQGTLSFQDNATRLRSQARVAAEVADAFMALPPAQRYAFTTWGVRDKDSWLCKPPNAGDGSDRPLLFDNQGQPKPAFDAVEAAFAAARPAARAEAQAEDRY
jgi:endo-1,4-beta-xylanase